MAQSPMLEKLLIEVLAPAFNNANSEVVDSYLDQQVTVNNYKAQIFNGINNVEVYFQQEYRNNAKFYPTIKGSDAPSNPTAGNTGSVWGSANWTSDTTTHENFNFYFNFVYNADEGWLISSIFCN